MARSFRFAGRPIWLAGHLLVLAAATSMVLLGHWQLGVSEHKGFSLQNFGYALQWWAFSLFALVMWAKILCDRSAAGSPAAPHPPRVVGEPIAYRRYVMPQTADGLIEADDPEQAAYNAYLAQLAGQSEDER